MNDSPPPASVPDTRWSRIRRYYERHEQVVDLAAFVGGFVFDMAMLDRIDAWATIIQQAAYLVLIAAILLQLFFAQDEAAQPPAPAASRLARRVREYRVPFVHFLLGTLLNLYTLFFFKSASLFVSFGFMLVLAALLAANESKRAKARLGLTLKFALFSLCLLAFCAAIVPVFVGSIGLFVFLLSMLAACVPVAVMYRRILIHAPQRGAQARRQVLLPFGAVLAIFLGLYLFRLIPPVPLSIPFMGVYHDVVRAGDEYRLSHERPFWRVWDNGDQKFAAQPGDRIFVYFRIFSPARFADEVRVRWYWKDGQGKWKPQDSIPIRITGGREEGFRGYGMKTNYQAGDWKVQVDTLDEREIGRIYFTVTPVPAGPRSFTVDVQ
ncbi:MAG TPA: DUF2914 domain-containing protein [Burkholderiales bacterium]|nr:DUF2914 domain-containing protein [Burkholderiales bacterium]